MTEQRDEALTTKTLLGRLGRKLRATSVVIALVMLVAGCSSFQSVDIDTDQGLEAIDPGDNVCVTTKSGVRDTFEVKRVTRTRIEGEHERYAASQIKTVERMEFDALRTTGLVVGVAAVAVVAAVSVMTGSGAPFEMLHSAMPARL